MLKIKQNQLFIYLILGLLTLVYILPGFTQFFMGVPATAYALGLMLFIYFLVGLDIVLRKKVIINKSLLVFLVLALVIVLSGFVNKTYVLKTVLYLNFVCIPFSISYVIQFIKKRNLDIEKYFFVFFRLVVLIQLPIVLLQKFGYKILIPFSRANQTIGEIDFMFGTFALKADHALGFFLIVYLLNIIFKIRSGQLKKIPYPIVGYIAVTILIMESNLTKLVFLIVLAYYFSLWIFQKVNVLGLGLIVLVLFLLYKLALTSSAIERQIDHMIYTLNDEYVLRAVENGYAKRPHVVLYQINHEKFKWIGNGPYDYYDIFKGEFRKTIHFSQLIWFYNDIGVFGFLLAFLALFSLVKGLSLNKESRRILILVLFLYLFMTNVFGDVSMMMSLLLLNNNLKYV